VLIKEKNYDINWITDASLITSYHESPKLDFRLLILRIESYVLWMNKMKFHIESPMKMSGSRGLMILSGGKTAKWLKMVHFTFLGNQIQIIWPFKNKYCIQYREWNKCNVLDRKKNCLGLNGIQIVNILSNWLL